MLKKEYKAHIEAVGKKIKSLREGAGYKSYETFATEHDLDRKQYWRMEKGQNFRFTSLLKIVTIHKISLKEFFEDFEGENLQVSDQ